MTNIQKGKNRRDNSVNNTSITDRLSKSYGHLDGSWIVHANANFLLNFTRLAKKRTLINYVVTTHNCITYFPHSQTATKTKTKPKLKLYFKMTHKMNCENYYETKIFSLIKSKEWDDLEIFISDNIEILKLHENCCVGISCQKKTCPGHYNALQYACYFDPPLRVIQTLYQISSPRSILEKDCKGQNALSTAFQHRCHPDIIRYLIHQYPLAMEEHLDSKSDYNTRTFTTTPTATATTSSYAPTNSAMGKLYMRPKGGHPANNLVSDGCKSYQEHYIRVKSRHHRRNRGRSMIMKRRYFVRTTQYVVN